MTYEVFLCHIYIIIIEKEVNALMIFDSQIWKRQLKKYRKTILTLNPDNEDDLDKLEFLIMESAFAIRKLIDSNKLSDFCDNYRFKLIYYNIKEVNFHIDFLNNHHIDKFYDLSKKKRTELTRAL